VLQVRRLFALHAGAGVGLAIALALARPAECGVQAQAGSDAAAQSISAPGALGEMPLPGGLRGVLSAIGDRAAADRSQFLLDFIRRSYDTPIRVKSDPREPMMAALAARFATQKTAIPNGSPETLPLPLPPAIWIDVVFGGRATVQTLAAQILQSRSASLFYYGLLSLDDATRAWLATEPALIAEVAERHPAAFHRDRAVFGSGGYGLEPRRLGATRGLRGQRRRRDVDVGDRLAEQRIAHRAARDPRFLAALRQDQEQVLQVFVRQPLRLAGDRRRPAHA